MASRALKRRNGTQNKRGYLPWVIALFLLAGLIVAGAVSAFALGNAWLKDLPNYEDSSAYNLAEKTRVYASDGTTLLAEFYLENREPLDSLNEMTPYVYQGTVATEDQRFYEHSGIDPMGIARAVVNNLLGGSTEGASTITQQFVRNTVLADEATEQTLKRKVREAYIAMKLEQIYSKDEILLMYLNTVNYGSGAYGIESAAEKYFSCKASELTLSQAALLVGIPQSPTYNNPINYPDNALARRNTVLNRMFTNGYIGQAEYDAAIAEPLGLKVSGSDSGSGIYAYPYFTSYVRQVLLENYSEAEVFKGGLTVTTTLDIDAQDAAEAACEAKENEVADDLEVALVAVDPSTGYIKALVGGKDYDSNEYNLATQAQRQTGSSFKTFTLAAAIDNGIDPASTYVDCSSNTTIGDWKVENYGGTSYGTRTVASAFAVSSNTGFARLCALVGPSAVAKMASDCGIQSNLEEVPSITLGSNGCTVREMAGAYATIATGGIQRDAVAIEKIVDSKGDVVFQADTTGRRVMTEEVAHATEQVMEGVIKNGTGTAARLNSQKAAGKTGTSQNWRDSWFCGITPQYSVAIWLGAREERQMPTWYSATSVFSGFLNQVLPRGVNESFPMDQAKKPDYRALTSSDKTALGAAGAPKASSSDSGSSASSSEDGSSDETSKSTRTEETSKSTSAKSTSKTTSADDDAETP
ncbi:transglycosylase domain-containing protein [Curtanaerobium respiraculi]|uniref:transglycosylase domain-containing protein n=1 Tax=Curtanaerobium respiraculi TaxID=2949669 RepID=UPI0024B320DC|nr:transglycosylase domain-containing protein [Curtanaerobium respiraculi]